MREAEAEESLRTEARCELEAEATETEAANRSFSLFKVSNDDEAAEEEEEEDAANKAAAIAVAADLFLRLNPAEVAAAAGACATLARIFGPA